MKKVFRFTLTLLVMAALFCSFGLAAFADSSVTYGTDRKFTVSPDIDLFDSFKNVMPGDTLTETITIRNNYRGVDLVRIYLKAVPHNSAEGPHLSNEDYDRMMEFLSQMQLTVLDARGNVISDDAADQTADLTRGKLVGRFTGRGSSTVTVVLQVPITMGNEFADRYGEVDWVFTAEEIKSTDDPKTGDNSHIFLYAGILVLSALAAWFILFYMRRKKAE